MQKRRCTKSEYWNTPEQNQKQPLWRLELNQFYRSVLRNNCLLFMTWLMRKDVYVTICFFYIFTCITSFLLLLLRKAISQRTLVLRRAPKGQEEEIWGCKVTIFFVVVVVFKLLPCPTICSGAHGTIHGDLTKFNTWGQLWGQVWGTKKEKDMVMGIEWGWRGW